MGLNTHVSFNSEFTTLSLPTLILFLSNHTSKKKERKILKPNGGYKSSTRKDRVDHSVWMVSGYPEVALVFIKRPQLVHCLQAVSNVQTLKIMSITKQLDRHAPKPLGVE